MLDDIKADTFAAGSLWATSVILNSILDVRQAEASAKAGRSSRECTREAIMALVTAGEIISPSEVSAHMAPQAPSASTISKALNDLLHDRHITQATAPDGADRRMRWFRKA